MLVSDFTPGSRLLRYYWDEGGNVLSSASLTKIKTVSIGGVPSMLRGVPSMYWGVPSMYGEYQACKGGVPSMHDREHI